MNSLDDIIKNKIDVMNSVNLTEEEFKHIVYWFKNKSSRDDKAADDPTLVLKNSKESYKGCTSNMSDDKGNTTWVTTRFANALNYARSSK
jgi:hypothetical protein